LTEAFRWIDRPGALAEAAERWTEAPEIALDTEFVRERTYYARLGLVQVFDGRHVDLIDTVALDDLTPLARVLADPKVWKIAHSASEDLAVLRRAAGVLPRPLLDTQIAASLAGMSPPPGYQRLIAEVLGVELKKEETRTDWVRRPLSAAQLAYAAEDVTHLLPAFHRLRDRLTELGRWEWAVEDSTELVEDAAVDEPRSEVFLRIRAASRLRPADQFALRELAAWREEEAERRDLPRRFVLSDELLFDLATKKPRTVADLKALKNYEPRQAERYAEAIVQLVGDVVERARREAPREPLVPPDLKADEKKCLEALRDLVSKRAEALGIRPDVLAKRRALERIARGEAKTTAEAFGGWRRGELEPLLAPLLAPPTGL
jgi:ribonuclease D